MESTPANGLCDICATIPFLQLYAKTQETGVNILKPVSWSLGKASDVRGRGYCPFCRLICEAFRRGLADDTDIEIQWGHLGKTFSCWRFPLETKIQFLDIRHRFLDRRIDTSRVRRWLSICSEDHPICLPHQSTPEVEIPNFRVIDVRRRRIAAMPNSIRYVALSYVWGQVDTYRLLKSNLKDLMKSESLTKIWGKLPRTIRDVFLFTEAIGERYLWIDTLCLIQDDENDKIPGIEHMDVVYSRAFCTIVAASGEHANAGIPGWGLIRRRAQSISEVLPGVNLILTQGMTAYLRQTQYDKRAWTFQEYFLSSRRIIFVNSQVYYLCRECYWREDDAERRKLYDDMPNDDSYLSILNFCWTEDDLDLYETWAMILHHYTKRQLTHESDMLNAMAGICRALSFRFKCSFFQGMPVAAFDLCLIFDTLGKLPEPTERLSGFPDNSWGKLPEPTERRRGFPSYSWAGWHGQIVVRDIIPEVNRSMITNHPVERGLIIIKRLNIWLSNHTWIVWYKYEPSTGAVSRIWDINQNPGFSEATEYDIGYRNIRSFRPKRGMSRLSLNDATTDPSPQYHIIDRTRYSYPLLQFWTVAVYLNASFSQAEDPDQAIMFDRNGEDRGYLYKNNASIDTHIGESQLVELILLCEHWRSYSEKFQHNSTNIQEFMDVSPEAECYSNDRGHAGPFIALWIRWDGGVAERVGHTWVSPDAMEGSLEPGPIWKEILLG